MTFYSFGAGGGDYVVVRRPVGLTQSAAFAMETCREPPAFIPRYEITLGYHGDRLGHRPGFGLWSVELVAALQSAEATGIHTHPVEVLVNGKPVTGFIGVRITGRGGHMDPTRSGITQWGATGVPLFFNAIYMNEADWDGTDVFLIPELGGRLFVTPKAADAIRTLRAMNDLRLTPNDRASSP